MAKKGRTPGSSIAKCENRTYLVHAHCSAAVGIFVGCSFHLRKYGTASMMIHGTHRPKYTSYEKKKKVTRSTEIRAEKKPTSCMMKLINPVAIIGSPIEIYQAAHCFSNQLNDEKSTPGYSPLCSGKAVALKDMAESWNPPTCGPTPSYRNRIVTTPLFSKIFMGHVCAFSHHFGRFLGLAKKSFSDSTDHRRWAGFTDLSASHGERVA